MKKLLTLVLLVLFNHHAEAEAYCSLRDPVAQIKLLYPQKTNQLSIVKEVDRNTRAQVQIELPNNDLHYSELGKHTLYVAINGKKTLGYIHVRSEQSMWGLVEIVWAIDKDLKITNFAFQRCRSPKKMIINEDKFKSMIIGKNYEQLKELLSRDGRTANKSLLKNAQNAHELANVVLMCALKTLLITTILWGEELKQFNK